MEASDNPFALAILAHFQTQETRGDAERRFATRSRLLRILLSKKWKREDIENFIEFLSWMLVLPKEMEERFDIEARKIEEEDQMTVISPFRRRAEDRGIEMGKKEEAQHAILSALQVRFGEYPESLEIRIRQINDLDKLRDIFKLTLTSENSSDFENNLEK